MSPTWYRWTWPVFIVLALLFLGIGNATLYGVAVPLAALAIALLLPGTMPKRRRSVDRQDLVVVAALYAGVVALFYAAFQVFTQDTVAGLFLTFAAGMLLGVVGPLVYTVWVRHRPLADLGLARAHLRPALGLGLVLAALQFAMTLWGYDLPQPVDGVPLLALSLTIGLFEAVFFRGFIQTRLEGSLGPIAGIGAASALYAVYHVGYGMGPAEMLFLFGLGIVYSVAFAVARNVAVLWPLLIPLGSFYNNLQYGNIQLPWMSILGFVDVLGLMAAVVWLAMRHQRRDATPQAGGRSAGTTRPRAERLSSSRR
jgi:membrane protease YdiL (CAAX protease family)